MDDLKESQERSMMEQSTIQESSPSQSALALNGGPTPTIIPEIQMLMEEVRRLRQQVEDQAYQLQRPPPSVRGSDEAEDGWTLPPPPMPLISNVSPFPVGYAQWGNDKDLYRLAKMVKYVTFEPKDERDYEDALDEWEAKSCGCGIHFGVVKNLLVHVGALKIRQAAAQIPISTLQWLEVKNRVARILFPFSRYRKDLEREIEEENRTLPVEDTLALLAKHRKRHSDLCVRWRQSNTLSDDRMKDALLAKLPADKVTPCLCVKDFHTFSYEDFAYYCRMATSVLDAGSKAVMKPISKLGHKAVSTPVVHAIQVAAVEDKSAVATPKRPALPDYICYNYGEKGHFAKGCPQPKAKCESCGRLGHKAASCTKLRHDGLMGRTRTGFLWMTRCGIHLDLIDEATKRALFDSMRKHLESQELAYEKARLKAQAKRDQKKAEELLSDIVPMETVETEVTLTEPSLEGLYEFIVLPFGLANAPSTFQQMTDALFRDPPLNKNVSVYIDDIVIYTKSVEQYFHVLRQVLDKLKETHLFVNLEKTVLFARKAKYLGFIIQNGEVTPDPKQISAIQKLQVPKDVAAIHRFLGLTGYFRHFIPNFSEKALPLTKLLKKGTPFEWSSTT